MFLIVGCGDDDPAPVGPGGPAGDAFNPGGDAVVTPADSCKGSCGGTAPAGCGCDNACFERKDCCSDKEPVCGKYKPPPPTTADKSCKGQCGHNAPGGCSCKDACEAAGNCCADKAQWCAPPKPPPTQPQAGCEGFCGKESPDGCWCHNGCHENDTCCSDKVHFCGDFKPPPVEEEASCKELCGKQAAAGCWCNNECHDAGNCCEDKELFCGPFKPPPGPEDSSCKGHCGDKAPSGCFCDNGCHEFNNCCEDKVLFCGEFNPPPPADQCKGFCGGISPAGCWCDNGCHANNNCCEDKVLFCGDFEPPPEPDNNSCLGICGQQAESGCWCNNDCHANDNCCGDKELHCGEFEPPPPEPNASCQGICGQQAESGCWCNAECHANDNCCEDKVASCGAPPDSCVDRCGEEAPAGCSCVDGCEAEATCCADKEEACGTPPDLIEGSCEGLCGEQTPQGCWCDDLCALNEDCCADKDEKCGTPPPPAEGSCAGLCGEQTPQGCWCDDNCAGFGDCCTDKEAECGADQPVGNASCAGICGQQAETGCWCDDSCEESDDCCQDKAEACGETTCEKLGHAQGSCFGLFSGSKCADGQPFECTSLETVGLTCWVQSDSCSPTQICVDPLGFIGAHCEADPNNPLNSCVDNCDGQAPGGCWCDDLCDQSGDCCADKATACGETTCEDLGHALGNCVGIFNGSKCEENQPYECQNQGSLKCWVQTDVCDATEICEDPLGPTGAHCEADPGNADNSCEGLCDGQAPSGCWCDIKCDQNGDCCPDKVEKCGEVTCEALGFELGSCGFFDGSKCEGGQPYACQEKGSLTCWVQSEICGEGQICDDPFGPAGAACITDPGNPVNSCEGACGGKAPGGCWCDDQCDQNGDCCPDKVSACGEVTCEALGFSLGACGLFSGTKCDNNQPYACTAQGSLNCWVQSAECVEGEKCVDPFGPADAKCEIDDGSPINSCEGNCGGQAAGGCWCDGNCENNGDCCADKEEKCGGTTCADLGFNDGECGLFSGSECKENGQPYECQDKGVVSCWIQTATCAENEVCVDPLGPTGAHCQLDTSEETCESLGNPLGECGLFSGSKCEGNQPYDCQEVGGLDCWVQLETCGAGQKCSDPFGPTGASCGEADDSSCWERCGEEAPGGCWCDDLCVENGDCCDDITEACPAE